MDETDATIKLNKYAGYALAILCAGISIALSALTIWMAVKYNSSRPNVETFFIITLGIIVPFALFFAVVAFRGLATLLSNRKEVMTTTGWRTLAVLLLVCGMFGLVYGGWLALLLPGAMALFCMMKERWASKRILSLLEIQRKYIESVFGQNKIGQ